MPISIDVDIDRSGMTAKVSGQHSCRPKNIYTAFGLNESLVYAALNKLDRSRTFEGFFFASIQTIMTPDSHRATVVKSHKEPVILARRIFRNDSRKTATYEAKVTHTEDHTVGVSWSRSEERDTNFEVGANFYVSGSGSMRFSNTVGQSSHESKTVRVGSDTGVNVTLGPGEQVVAMLKVNRRVLKLRVDYTLSQTGHLAAADARTHANYTFDINDIIQKAGLPKERHISQNFVVTYYSDAKVVLRDDCDSDSD